MIDYDGSKLPLKQQDAQRRLKESKDKDEKLSLANYIGNLYVAQVCMGNDKLKLDRKKLFGGKRKYNSIIKRINIYDDQLLENFILHKDFHHQYFGEVLPPIEEELEGIFDYSFEVETLKKDEIIDITHDFMSSLTLEKLFDEFYESGRIHSAVVGQSKDNMGFTLYDPTTKDIDIFVRRNIDNFMSLLTLVHEFGHAYDLFGFTGNIKEYNEYFYASFYGEVMSRLFERLLYRYLIKNDIKANLAKDYLINSEDSNHDYLLQAYVLSSLDEDFLKKGKYLHCSDDMLVKKVKKYFLDEENLKTFIGNIEEFDLSNDYNYAYGDILSMCLCEEAEENLLVSEKLFYFMEHRKEMFNPELLKELGFGPANYVELYKKELELIKK